MPGDLSVKKIFELAIAKKASDIHLVVGLAPMVRVGGSLIKLIEPALSGHAMESIVFSLLEQRQKERLLRNKELDISHETASGRRFRLNVYYERGNLGLAARVISQDIPTLEDIDIPPVVPRLLTLRQGLILVTGPTGCGKSTTLAAMVETINKEQNRNIITLEDPIEFLFTSKKSIVIQRQLGTDMLSFQAGLKHIVRQDPDVIMVGEMRDLETIAATVTLAETGHLVLATLHTYSAAQTIDRIIDTFPPYQQGQIKTQLSSVLAAVISQRLVVSRQGGQVAAREVLINSPAVANLIRENKISQIQTVIETSRKEGMISMERSLQHLHKENIISEEEMKLHLLDPWTS